MLFVILGVVVLVGGLITAVLAQSGVFSASNSEPMQIPIVGTCTDQVAGVLHLHEPLKTKDCSDPSAIFKVVESEIITGTGLDVNCDAGVEMRITTQGKHYGKGATAHSCAALNLIVGHCYSRSGTYRKYETDCRAGGRLHQKIEGIADEDACDFLAPEEPGAAMEWIPITMIDHVDEREPATYCFVPVS
ncbi:hypothetical protein DFR74_1241 [Nocardia puris]|uniref:Uncharacterized protein n=1 Tax=Nocardia puris TaxID=208602 RepID=A0A366CWC2_9NOCA|nr:hypothetical protein DFR74_1241 [Nocardia puris]